jgi:hypothetical protein
VWGFTLSNFFFSQNFLQTKPHIRLHRRPHSPSTVAASWTTSERTVHLRADVQLCNGLPNIIGHFPKVLCRIGPSTAKMKSFICSYLLFFFTEREPLWMPCTGWHGMKVNTCQCFLSIICSVYCIWWARTMARTALCWGQYHAVLCWQGRALDCSIYHICWAVPLLCKMAMFYIRTYWPVPVLLLCKRDPLDSSTIWRLISVQCKRGPGLLLRIVPVLLRWALDCSMQYKSKDC